MPEENLSIPENFSFHHLGYATASMSREKIFFKSLGYTQEGEDFLDPIQKIQGCFLVGAGPRIELLENLPGADTLSPWLDMGIKMYHMAYRVDDIDLALDWARGLRGLVIVPPVQSVAFNLKRISFVMFRNKQMLEFIEK